MSSKLHKKSRVGHVLIESVGWSETNLFLKFCLNIYQTLSSKYTAWHFRSPRPSRCMMPWCGGIPMSHQSTFGRYFVPGLHYQSLRQIGGAQANGPKMPPTPWSLKYAISCKPFDSNMWKDFWTWNSESYRHIGHVLMVENGHFLRNYFRGGIQAVCGADRKSEM